MAEPKLQCPICKVRMHQIPVIVTARARAYARGGKMKVASSSVHSADFDRTWTPYCPVCQGFVATVEEFLPENVKCPACKDPEVLKQLLAAVDRTQPGRWPEGVSTDDLCHHHSGELWDAHDVDPRTRTGDSEGR